MRDHARDVPHLAIELGRIAEIEYGVIQIMPLTFHHRNDVGDDTRDVRRRLALLRGGEAPLDAAAGIGIIAFGNLHADNAAPAPSNRAGAKGRIENREALIGHG
jgi:hypothetical protein